MTTLTHGSNQDCPAVLNGTWDHCLGHEIGGDESATCADILGAVRFMMRVPEGVSILEYTTRLMRRANKARIDGNPV